MNPRILRILARERSVTNFFFPLKIHLTNIASHLTLLTFYAQQTYKHFVYGVVDSFRCDYVDAQIRLIRMTSSGLIIEKGFVLTCFQTGNLRTTYAIEYKGRFWHTLNFTTTNGLFSSASITNKVTCDPALSTGSTAVLSFEDKYSPRGC